MCDIVFIIWRTRSEELFDCIILLRDLSTDGFVNLLYITKLLFDILATLLK